MSTVRLPVDVDAGGILLQHSQPLGQFVPGRTDRYGYERKLGGKVSRGVLIQSILDPLELVKGLLVAVVGKVALAVLQEEEEDHEDLMS